MLALLLIACQPITTPDALNDRLAAVIERRLNGPLSDAGFAATIVDGDVRLAEHVRGETSPGGAPFSAQTLVPMASATKILTTVVTLQLVEEGALDLDDTVAGFAPDLPATLHPLTVRDLLRHADGLAEAWDHPAWPPADDTFAAHAALAADLPLRFPTGHRQRYGNSGFVVLGHLIEAVEGEPFEEVVAARIFRPLGMETSDFSHSGRELPGFDRAVFTRRGERVALDYRRPDVAIGAWVASLDDAARLAAALADGRLLDADTFTTVADGVGREGFGLGFVVHHRADTTALEHSGGQSTLIAAWPDEGLAFAAASNVAEGTVLDTAFSAFDLGFAWARR